MNYMGGSREAYDFAATTLGYLLYLIETARNKNQKLQLQNKKTQIKNKKLCSSCCSIPDEHTCRSPH